MARDAVAGVVNIKMRHKLRWRRSDVEYGNTLDKDSGLYAADAILRLSATVKDPTFTGSLIFHSQTRSLTATAAFSNRAAVSEFDASPYISAQ